MCRFNNLVTFVTFVTYFAIRHTWTLFGYVFLVEIGNKSNIGNTFIKVLGWRFRPNGLKTRMAVHHDRSASRQRVTATHLSRRGGVKRGGSTPSSPRQWLFKFITAGGSTTPDRSAQGERGELPPPVPSAGLSDKRGVRFFARFSGMLALNFKRIEAVGGMVRQVVRIMPPRNGDWRAERAVVVESGGLFEY